MAINFNFIIQNYTNSSKNKQQKENLLNYLERVAYEKELEIELESLGLTKEEMLIPIDPVEKVRSKTLVDYLTHAYIKHASNLTEKHKKLNSNLKKLIKI